MIEEGSDMMSKSSSMSSLSHFEPVKFESDDEDQDNLAEDKQIVIKTSDVKNKVERGSDSPIEFR